MGNTITARSNGPATIWSVYRPIEAYRDLLPAAEEPAHDPAARFQPLDAYLIHLLLNLLPARSTLVDLAADTTWGATTVLGLTHPRVRRVLLPESGAAHEYRLILEHYRAEYAPAPVAALETLSVLPGTPEWAAAWDRSEKSRGHVFLLATDHEANGPLLESVRHCLAVDPDSLVILLGLGQVGQCGAVQTLLGAYGAGSDGRFWLMRELGDCLLSSQVGLIARRANARAEDAVKRLQQMYRGNFTFLNLVKKACLAAIQAADVDATALKEHHTGWLVENREVVAKLERSLGEARDEVKTLQQALDDAQQARTAAQNEIRNIQNEIEHARNEILILREETQSAWQMHGQACADLATMRQALWEKDQLLASIQASLVYRSAHRVRQVRQWLLPEGSWRFRCYRKMRHAAGIWRAEGLSGLTIRVARKCWPGGDR